MLKWPWPHARASRTDWTTAEMKIASLLLLLLLPNLPPSFCAATSACASSSSAFLCLQSPFIRVNGFHQRKKCISSGRKDRLTRVRGVWQRARPPASPLPALHPSRRHAAVLVSRAFCEYESTRVTQRRRGVGHGHWVHPSLFSKPCYIHDFSVSSRLTPRSDNLSKNYA